MISVITLTYKRRKVLEEAINSFILQDVTDCEMIILNDVAETTYTLDLSEEQKNALESKRNTIRVINEKTRYSTILEKLVAAFNYARHDYMYRLDDDDLLSEPSLKDAVEQINNNPGYDIYRSRKHHAFTNNKYGGDYANTNTGNIYTKKYINSISDWRNGSFGEDVWLTYNNKADIYTYDSISMIYRWGMSTYHVSAQGDIEHGKMVERIDNIVSKKARSEIGDIVLQPAFEHDYYRIIREDIK